MTVIRVPVPAENSFNPDRPVSGLLKAQILHLQDAEKRLPLDLRSTLYINAIQTEGEAAEYIRHVTGAIHEAHAQAAQQRAKRRRKTKPSIDLAAAADEQVGLKSPSVRRTRTSPRTDRGKTKHKT